MRHRLVRALHSRVVAFPAVLHVRLGTIGLHRIRSDGTVKDQSSAGLPGATITVTQTDTGLTRSAVSDEAGSYVLQNLPIGPYRFEAELQGFRSSSRPASCCR